MHSRLSAGQTGRRAEAPVSPDRGFSVPTRDQQETSFSGANHSVISTMAGDLLSDEESTMALDPDAERVLEMVRQSGRPPYDQVTPAEARALFRAARDVLCPTPAPVAEIRDLAAPGLDGGMSPAAALPRQRVRRQRKYYRHSSIFMAAAGLSAILIAMTVCAAISPTPHDVRSSRSITAWRRSTNSRRPSKTASPPPDGSPKRAPR